VQQLEGAKHPQIEHPGYQQECAPSGGARQRQAEEDQQHERDGKQVLCDDLPGGGHRCEGFGVATERNRINGQRSLGVSTRRLLKPGTYIEENFF
jgi:hypothetical protein